jgi:hypothetical protein
MTQIDDAFLCAFGAIAVHFSELEESLFWYTVKLANPEDFGIGEATLAGIDFKHLTEIFEALVRERTGCRYTLVGNPHGATATKIQDQLTPLVSKLNKVRDRRNEIIHAHWRPHLVFNAASESFVQSKGSIVRTKRKKKQNKGSISKTTRWTGEELQAVAVEIEKAATALDQFVTWANTLTPLFPEEEE